METSNSKSNELENFYKAYKRMFHIKDLNKKKVIFDAFLIKTNSIPNFMKIISSPNDDDQKRNYKKITKNSFENYVLDENIKLHYLFEECEHILNHNLEKENTFIIVVKSFLEKMNINLDGLEQKYVTIYIDKNKSSYSIKFPLSNKEINFIELKSGIYQFDRNNNITNKNQLVYNKSPPFLEKIKSKYIFHFISSFFKDKNYLLKLIKYSKNLQQKLNINLSNYIEIYANKRIYYEDFLRTKVKRYRDPPNIYNNLKKELVKNQINDKDINTFAQDYFTNYYNNLDNKEDSLYEFSKDIDFTSPFFDTLSKTEIFNKIFNIKISTKVIKEIKLKDATKSKFEELNNSKIEYQSIIFKPDDEKDINMLKELNIDFSKLKKFAFLGGRYLYLERNFNFKELINSLNINNNLVYFEYKVSSPKRESSEFEFINNLNSLEYLGLTYLNFPTKFHLKLKNLKYLKIIFCNNISLRFCELSKIKYLQIRHFSDQCLNNEDNTLLKFPNLNVLVGVADYDKNIIDFGSLKNLKQFQGFSEGFLLLKETSCLNQIILESVLDKEDIEKIKLKFPEQIYSVTKLDFGIKPYDGLNFDDFLNIFPNLSDLTVKTPDDTSGWSCGYDPIPRKKKIIINENKNSKIKNIKIIVVGRSEIKLEISCESYTKIQSLDIHADAIDIDFLNIFSEDKEIIFNSLTTFKFNLECKKISVDLLVKIMGIFYKNIKKMPNLINFSFSIINKKESNYIKKSIFESFIYRIISLKFIKNIFIKICDKYYSPSEKDYSKEKLKLLFPKIDFNKFHKIYIYNY